MTFLAQPSDVTSILGGLKYKTSKAMSRETIVNDVVVVRVMDGVGGACLSAKEHKKYFDTEFDDYSSIRKECFEVSASVPVILHQNWTINWDDDEDTDDSKNKGWLPFTLPYQVMLGLFALTICCCSWCFFACVRICCSCMMKGRSSKMNTSEDDETASGSFESPV
jgi:hypothetical protein